MGRTKLIAAPLQGFTEAVWRRMHADVFGGIDEYCLPFARVEKGEARRRDVRELTSALDSGLETTAQAIFADGRELETIVEAVKASGRTRLDLNLGCPFPPQVRHGRGAGVLRSAEALRQMGECVLRHGEMEFSVKMRLGVDNAGEWHAAMDVLNELPLRRVTVHPRVATQQYGGEPDLEEAALVMEACAHPVVYNGDVRTAADIDRVLALFPKAAGVMIGRGLLSSPWMAREWLDGEALTAAQRIDGLRRMHDGILAHYEETLCGDTQVLMKIKPLWEYLGAGAGRKELKAIKKATKLGAYRQAAEAALSSIGAGQSS